MNRTAYIFVPGILNYPGSAIAWTDKAVTWIHQRQTCECAEKFEYLALPLSARLLAERRAKDLAALMARYPVESFSVVLAGHSNGCDIIRRALWLAKRPANWVHFFAPAVAANPSTNRLGRLIQSGRIGFLRIHLAARDGILNNRFLGGLPLATVQAQFADEHHAEIDSEPFGHCGWWAPAQFEASMKQICGDPQERSHEDE